MFVKEIYTHIDKDEDFFCIGQNVGGIECEIKIAPALIKALVKEMEDFEAGRD